MHSSFAKASKKAVPLYAIAEAGLRQFLATRTRREVAFLRAAGFTARENELLLMPNASGELASAFLGLGKALDPLAPAQLAERLPAGTYRYAAMPERFTPALTALAWTLGTYKFSRYRKKVKPAPKLALPQGADSDEVSRIADAVFLARDLINTPANDMGPAELAAAAQEVAKRHGAKVTEIAGEALNKQNYPLIHAVGRGSARPPRLIDLRWGKPNAPKLTLVGKGCASTPAATTSNPPPACSR